jgi:hypothetical protein
MLLATEDAARRMVHTGRRPGQAYFQLSALEVVG